MELTHNANSCGGGAEEAELEISKDGENKQVLARNHVQITQIKAGQIKCPH